MAKEKRDKHFLHKPTYEGGPKAMREFIKKHLVYPPEALAKAVEGTVQVGYDVGRDGLVTEAHVITGIGHGCDEEAVRLVRMLRFEVPKNRGMKVVYHHKLNINFKLAKPAPAAQAPATATTLQYTVTTTKPKPEAEQAPAPKPDGYSYTIKW